MMLLDFLLSLVLLYLCFFSGFWRQGLAAPPSPSFFLPSIFACLAEAALQPKLDQKRGEGGRGGTKGGVVHLALSRGHNIAFWLTVSPLQVALSLACSVASLCLFPSY